MLELSGLINFLTVNNIRLVDIVYLEVFKVVACFVWFGCLQFFLR